MISMKKSMKKLNHCLVVSLALTTALPAGAQTRVRHLAHPVITEAVKAEAPQPKLPLKRVILYSNSVAYFERQGNVNGNQIIGLQFTPEELDDVLKSMVVLDLGQGAGQGRISEVTFDTAKPVNVALAEFAFNLAGDNGNNAGLTKLLSSFRGASVEVKQDAVAFTGRIVGVETRDSEKADGTGAGPRPQTKWLTLLNDNGEARSFQLSQLTSARLLDPALRSAVARYMSLVGGATMKDSKTVSINATGAGPRQLLVSYTIAAPVWKTSYRAVIDSQGRPFLQGWAIVDNVQDEDWENIDLSLVSGMPISFIENLKQPLYRGRPTVALSQGYSVMPQTSEADRANVQNNSITLKSTIDGRQITNLPLAGRNATEMLTLSPGTQRNELKNASGFFAGISPAADAAAEVAAIGGGGVIADATTEDIGELFQYHIGHPVTIGHNHSAMIPIVQSMVEGEAVSIYNERAHYGNPLNGLNLKNTTGLTLEGGPITVIEGNSYAGEALIDRLKPNETRFITYAVDLGVRISTKQGSEEQNVTQIKMINGQLSITTKRLETKTYTIVNASDKSKVLVIEHPRRPGFKLVSDVKPTRETDNFSRFRLELKPNATSELVVKEEQPLVETHAVDNFTNDQISVILKQKSISPELKAQLTQIAELKARDASLDETIQNKKDTIDTIFEDQERLRENIKSLGQSPDERRLVGRYVTKLEEAEMTIDNLRKEIKSLEETSLKLHQEIATALRNLASD